jgi:hypothetical protein
MRFGVAGATNLAGIIGGTGATGIVLSHMSDGNVCQWILSFNELIGKGYKVLAYDSHGSGVSDSAEVGFEQDVVAAVETPRADGATSIVLMGASLGDAARQLAEASTASPDARYLVTPGSVHGNGIIDPGGDEKLRAAVADFLTDHAPPACSRPRRRGS